MADTTDNGRAAGGEPARVCVDAVSQRFGGVRALTSVSLEVPSGELLGVIGPNGAGKTTLFDIIAGARRPTDGRVLFDGKDITRAPAWKRARLGIRRTFQRQQPIGWLSVEDNVLAALDCEGGGGGVAADLIAAPWRRRLEVRRRQRVAQVLEVCGIGPVAGHHAAALSIGEARRLELARAIVAEPSLLLLDEPTSGLAEPEVEVFASIVRALRDETSCAVVLIEHDVPFVMSLCDRVVVMDEGRVLTSGPPEEITADVAVREAYLG